MQCLPLVCACAWNGLHGLRSISACNSISRFCILPHSTTWRPAYFMLIVIDVTAPQTCIGYWFATDMPNDCSSRTSTLIKPKPVRTKRYRYVSRRLLRSVGVTCCAASECTAPLSYYIAYSIDPFSRMYALSSPIARPLVVGWCSLLSRYGACESGRQRPVGRYTAIWSHPRKRGRWKCRTGTKRTSYYTKLLHIDVWRCAAL